MALVFSYSEGESCNLNFRYEFSTWRRVNQSFNRPSVLGSAEIYHQCLLKQWFCGICHAQMVLSYWGTSILHAHMTRYRKLICNLIGSVRRGNCYAVMQAQVHIIKQLPYAISIFVCANGKTGISELAVTETPRWNWLKANNKWYQSSLI